METYGVPQLSADVFGALSLLTPYDIDVPKVRVGAPRDGGYVMAQLESGSDLLSFGIANDVRFEMEMATKGHRCFMYDHTIDDLPDHHKRFNFFKKGICGEGQQTDQLFSLGETLKSLPCSERFLLKMDVEGAEWDVFSTVSDEVLSRFDQIVGEFHWLLELGHERFRTKFCEAMANLNKHFTLFHVHANNCRELGVVNGFAVADVLELSFIRTSLISRCPSVTVYPTSLDRANSPAVGDHALLFYPFLPMAVDTSAVTDTITRIKNDIKSNDITRSEMAVPAVDFEAVISDGYRWILGVDPGKDVVKTQAQAIEPKTMAAVRQYLMASLPKEHNTQMVLHQARSAFLRDMPKGAKTFLSAGCAGAWFFDWIEQTYGRPKLHIGLEYYSPKPNQLPDNVIWIANTCSDMSGVDSASCDLVFSGQNYEHLWPDEQIGFLLEAARVTREGGVLVMDSPNRDITRLLNWTHPEHTVEATPEEAAQAMELAGFDVTARKGIWLCRDNRTGTVLPFEAADQAGWSLTERLLAGYAHPENSFIWWLEGRRTSRNPKRDELSALLHEIYRKAWPERLERLYTAIGSVGQRDEGTWYSAPAGSEGALMYGPYIPLRPGRYSCTFEIETSAASGDQPLALCDVVSGQNSDPIAQKTVMAVDRKTSVRIDFALDQLMFGVQFRCISYGRAAIACRRKVSLVEEVIRD